MSLPNTTGVLPRFGSGWRTDGAQSYGFQCRLKCFVARFCGILEGNGRVGEGIGPGSDGNKECEVFIPGTCAVEGLPGGIFDEREIIDVGFRLGDQGGHLEGPEQ